MSFIKLKLRRCNLSFSPSSPPSLSPLTNKQCSLLHAWGTCNRSPSSVRQIAGEMDVSVSQRCLISVRCSMYCRLFRGLLASKLHTARFLSLRIVWGKQSWAHLCLVVFQLFTELFFLVVRLRRWLACQFTVQHSNKKNKSKGFGCNVARSNGWQGGSL